MYYYKTIDEVTSENVAKNKFNIENFSIGVIPLRKLFFSYKNKLN